MGTQNTVVQLSPGLAAAERCRPYMDKARESFLEACKKIGDEYAALADDQKRVFRDELRLSKRTLEDYPNQLRLDAAAWLQLFHDEKDCRNVIVFEQWAHELGKKLPVPQRPSVH